MTFRFDKCRRALIVGATGFLFLSPAAASGQAKPDSASTPPSPLDAVVVSATRSEQALGSLPSPVYVLGAPAIAATPSGTVPDLLRSIPGFATRDYQSGVIASPSRSIVSFRGLGGSSAGRVLVLLDGLPIGDPFSGWLDWGRIPISMLASAEVIRGGGSVIWGSRALGGVVNLRTIEPRRNEVSVLLEGGTFDTWHGSGTASLRQGKVSAVIAADYVDTEGFILVPQHQAGPVDEPQSMTNRVVSAKATYDATPALQGWVAGSTFTGGESPWRTGDDQSFHEGRAGLRWLGAPRGIATVGAFANSRSARLDSYTINAARTTSVPNRYNRSPARSAGINFQWTQTLLQRHEVTTGIDFTDASGSITEEYAFVNGNPTEERKARGSQQFAGIFVQDAADLGHSVHMVASARIDRVHSSDGGRTIRALPSQSIITDSAYSKNTDVRLTYSLGFRKQQSSWLGLRVNLYEAFRAPSMFEMYHPRFSGRGTVTEANPALEAERLRGAEAGADVSLGRSGIARLTAFTNHVNSPIMDVTVGTAGSQPTTIPPCGLMPASQTCSQRRNVPGLRSNGLEADLSWKPTSILTLAGAYSYSSTRVRAPGQPADGKQAIRSAPHSFVSSVGVAHPRWLSVAVEGRYVGPRFEDDLNSIKLDEFWLAGLRINRSVGSRTTAHVRVENLLDEEFEVTRTGSGLAERGAGRWVTVGLRTTW